MHFAWVVKKQRTQHLSSSSTGPLAGHHLAAPRSHISPGACPHARRCSPGLVAVRLALAARATVSSVFSPPRRRRGQVQPRHVAPLRWDNRCALHARILLSLPPPPKWDHPTPWSRCVRVNARTPCCPTSNRARTHAECEKKGRRAYIPFHKPLSLNQIGNEFFYKLNVMWTKY